MSGNRMYAWRLSSLQPSQLPSFQGLCLDEMAVLQTNPTGLTARHSIATLHPHFDAKGKWRYWPGPSWNTPAVLPQSPVPATCFANPFTEKPFTDWSTQSQDTHAQSIQHSEDVYSKDSFSPNLSTNFWDSSLSPNSASDYDSQWGAGTDLCSNATSTFSQCSSSDSWRMSYDVSGDPPNIDRTDTAPLCDQGKISLIETANRRSTLQPLVGMSRDAYQGLNDNVPKFIPLECQYTVGYENLSPTSSTGNGNDTQRSQAPLDAQDVAKPDPYAIHGPLRRRSHLFDQVDCQTLNPTDIWPQAGVIHASELPLNTTNDTVGDVDQHPASQFDNVNLHPVDQPNTTPPSHTFSNILEEDTYFINKKASSKSRNRIRDDFLVRSKLAGMSYKEIRTKGNFTEAESTLRGRFRTLTKRKEQRVRKPQWYEKDIKLLEQAVNETLASNRDITQQTQAQAYLSGIGDGSRMGPTKTLKIPWKQVSEWIYRHGGSYKFGNATCRKKWDEIFGAGQGEESGVDD